MAAVEIREIPRGEGQPGDPCIYCQLAVSVSDLTSVPCHVSCEDEASLKRNHNPEPKKVRRSQSLKLCRMCGLTHAQSPRRGYARGIASTCISCEAKKAELKAIKAEIKARNQ